MNVSTKKMNSIHKKRRKYIKDAADTFRTHITFRVNVPADLSTVDLLLCYHLMVN